MRTVSFSQLDLELFSAASGDRNPLHLSEEYARQTVYGQPVVFGVLGVIAALPDLADAPGGRIRKLRAEFLRPMFRNVEYSLRTAGEGAERTASLSDGTVEVLRIAASVDKSPADDAVWDGRWPAKPRFDRREAADRPEHEIAQGLKVSGSYSVERRAFEAVCGRYEIGTNTFVCAALCWTSYLIGMEVPGMSALFSRLDLSLAPRKPEDLPPEYSIAVLAVDPRLAQVRLGVSLGGGAVSGELRAFVRSEIPRDSALAEAPDPQIAADATMSGKVALIVGSSRGLGAAVKAALEARGATVYSISRSAGGENSETGDAKDPVALERLRNRIIDRHQRLDILICNAFPALLPLRLEPNALTRITDYMGASLGLVLSPFCAFLSLLDASGGRVAVISSAAVTRPVREWPHYVAAKRAIEGLAEVAVLQYPRIGMLIVRPEKMLTAMTNTPMGKRGAVPPGSIAGQVADRLNRLEPGSVSYLP